MEIGKDQHQEAFMYNIDEDSRDDDEDEDENRFIISLDDLDEKEDSLDESDNCCKEQEDTRGAHCVAETLAISPRYPKSTLNAKSQNVIHTGFDRGDAGLKAKTFVFQGQEEPVSETFPPIIVRNKERKSFSEESGLISPKSTVLDSTNQESNGSFQSKPRDGIINHSVSVETCDEFLSVTTDTELGKSSKSSLAHRTLTKFMPHENCSCIMCYQGRGVANTTKIAKAAKRKKSMSVSQVPSKAIKQTPVNVEPDALSHSGKNSPLFSQKEHVPSITQLHCNESPLPGSQAVRSQLSQGVPAVPSNSSLAGDSQKCSPKCSSPLSGTQVSCKHNSSPGKPSIPLPVLIPKPPSHFTSTPSLTSSQSIASDLSLQGNATPKSLNLTSSNVQMHPLASDKTHVVLINKSTAEKQLTDLNSIFQRATKVDLSKPGMALVHFKLPKSITNASNVSSQISPPKLSVQSSMPSSDNNTGINTLHGLVKHHLINPSILSSPEQSARDQSMTTSTCLRLAQNSLSGVPRTPNLLSKPHFQYSLVNGMSISGNTSMLPPPPPLQPCPSSTHICASKPPERNSNAIHVEKHQTETIVLPLPKSENNKGSPSQDTSVGTAKQDELLLSPSLFTFCSSMDLSPQKEVPVKNGLSNDLSNLNGTSQYQQLFPNRLPTCHPLPLSSSLSSSLCQPGISMKSPSITSSTCTIPMTTVSSTMSQQSLLHFSSTPSNLPQAESGTHRAFLPENQMPVTSGSSLIGNFNKSNSSRKANSQWQSGIGWINIPPPQTSLLGSSATTTSGTSVSIVSNVDGLKMKIRLKDKKSNETIVPSDGNEELQNMRLVKSSHIATEVRSFGSDMYPQDASKEQCTSFSSEVSTIANVSGSHNSVETDDTSKAKNPMETAEEMFKRFEDQAMQEVYNAQFGVGEVQRNLRPNRTPFLTSVPLHSYTKVKTNSGEPSHLNQSGVGIQRKRAVKGKRRGSGDNRQKLPDEKQSKIDIDQYPKLIQDDSILHRKTGEPSQLNQSGVGIQRKRPVKGKRRGSGDNRQKLPDEKQSKIDIDQYPKLIQDNSILHRKTVFTPNILAGHKVFVKFNVFSNGQSGRSFLAPFFNIGGSRTQFDVEDMEYIKNAVIEFEKEEKSCARHLLYYSREGKKAIFLRKESGLHSNELSPKSYKKYSYILEGYKRERPKQTYQPSENWKVDNKVLIEIDRAEQDSEIDLQSFHTKGNLKSSNQTSVKLSACGSALSPTSQNGLLLGATENSSLPLSSPTFDLPNAQKSCTQKSDEHRGDLHRVTSKTVPKKGTYSHRNFVNILKKRKGSQKKDTTTNNSTAPSMKKASPVPESCHPEFRAQSMEPVALDNSERNGSLSYSGTSFDYQKVSSCKDQGLLKDTLQGHIRENISETVSNIKTEVSDDGYDSALNFKGNKVNPTSEIAGLTIKSEPIDDYTESLARSMNVSLQSNHTSEIESPAAFQKDGNVPGKLEDLPLEVDNISETNSKVQSKAVSDFNEPLNAFKSVNTTDHVSHSCSNISDDRIPSAESGSVEASTSNILGSSKMTLSSEDETSEDEESDEDILPFISSMSHSASTNPSSVLNRTNTNTPAASRKINSLVESLAQRLSQNSVALPPLFPTSLPQKKRKRKKEKIFQKHTDLKENSLPSTSNDVKDVASIQSFAASVSQMSLNPPSTYSKTITAPAYGSNTSTTRMDMRPLSLSHIPSGSSSPLTSLTPENSSCKMSDKVLEIGTLSFRVDGDQDKEKRSELLYNDVKEGNNKYENVSHSLTNDTKGMSQLSENAIRSIESSCFLEPRIESKDFPYDTAYKLSEKTEDSHENPAEKKCFEISDSDTFPTDTHSDGEIEIDTIFSEHEEGNPLSNTENEIGPKPKSDSNCSTPCSEIDVGMDEVPVESSTKCDSVSFGTLLASPPVSCKGKVYIKDFTKEGDLMLAFEAGTKRQPQSNAQSNAKPTQTSRRNRNKTAKAGPRDIKTGSPSPVDLKPSIASLLCKKLAIEVEPVVPKPVKASSVLTNSNAFPPKEQTVPSVGKAFYKPTLSAIFGVDDLPLPCLEKIKEKQDKSSPVVLTGRQRQVAVKGIHGLRRSKTGHTLSPLKMGKQSGQKESRKNDTAKRPNPPTGTSLRKQKYGLQSFFRTWRQLSHEERKKKEMKGIESQEFCTIPCKVVIERLEDMQLRTNGQPVKTECDSDENPVLDFENKEREERSLTLKKRRKRTLAKVQRRRQRREKKDIVDYYASMLESLRKKAQMLEEEDSEKKESKTEKSNCEMDRIIKIEPITFQDDSGSLISEEDGNRNLNMVSESGIELKEKNCLQHVKKCGQDAEIDKNMEDTLLGEDKNESVIDATSDDQGFGSVLKPPLCLQTSQSANEVHASGIKPDKEDESLPVNADNLTKTVRDDSITSNVNSPALRSLHEHDLREVQGSPTDITQSSTKNPLLPFPSNTDILPGNEQFLKKCPAGSNNVDEMETDQESRQTPDSSFKAKDIVLGFESEPVGDTDFSTASQDDIMEDLFLLGDGEDDSSMGMIPTEEVEKLLGLDLTSEGSFDTKQQKAETIKTSDLSSSYADGKLQWVPLPEMKEKSKDVDDKKEEVSKCHEIVPGNEQVQQNSPEHSNSKEAFASDGHGSENALQSQQKKLQVSPSWNRLLGLEALRKMEKPIPSSSQPIVDGQTNLLPSSSKLRVKFDRGALSKVLKLSAEMKRVFADGYSKEALEQHSSNVGKCMLDQPHKRPSKTKPSDINLSSNLSDVRTDHEVIDKDESNMQSSHNVQVGNEQETDESTKFIANAVGAVQNDNEGCHTTSKTQVLQRQTRKRSRSKSEQHVFENNILEKVSDSTQSDSNDSKAKIIDVSSSNYEPSANLPNGLQSSSIDASLIESPVKKTPHSKPSAVVRTSHVRGIDLNKLKLKLNPLLSANKGALSAISNSNVKIHSLSSQVLSDKTEDKNVSVFEKNCPRLPLPDGNLELEAGHHPLTRPKVCTPPRENASHNKSPTTKDSNMNQLGKQRTESEPVLNTVKLCNILKKVIRPNSLPKSLKSPLSSKISSSQFQSSIIPKNRRRLRSSPKSMKSSNDPSVSGMPIDSLPFRNDDQSDEKKKMEEDRTERSFFDCLSGGISGAWEKS